MTFAELKRLNGRVVLVESATDRHQPPTGVRGSIEVHQEAGREPLVQIAFDLPQMFGRTARHQTIPLSPADIERLLASERNGSLEYVLPEPIDLTPGYRND